MKGEFDQLAAVLKSCGIVASHYDATNMAQSINDGVRKSSEYFSRAYHEFQQDGKVDYTQSKEGSVSEQLTTPSPSLASVFENAPSQEAAEQPLPEESEPVADIIVESAPSEEVVEEKKTISIFEEEEDALQAAEDILREKEVEQLAEKKEVIDQSAPQVDLEIKSEPVAQVQELQVAPEPIAEPVAAPAVEVAAPVAPVAAEPAAPLVQSVPAPAPEELAKKLAEEMVKKMMAEQQAQQQKLQEQLLQQQQMMAKLMQQQAAAQAAAAQPKPVEQPKKQQQTFTYPAKNTSSQSSAFREVPVDRNRPKPTLTKEEMKSTDITHWFNFSKR